MTRTRCVPLIFFAMGTLLRGGDGSASNALKRVLRGHASEVTAIAFSPDGSILASGSTDRTIKLWKLRGKGRYTLSGHKATIEALSFSPDCRILVSSSWGGPVCLWEVASGKIRQSFAVKARQTVASGDKLLDFGSVNVASVMSRDGSLVAASGVETVLWDVRAGRVRATLDHEAEGLLALSPDGKTLAATSAGNVIKLWDVETGKQKGDCRGHRKAIHALAFSPDGAALASSSGETADSDEFEGAVKVWSVASKRCLGTLGGRMSMAWSVAFSPDGKFLVGGYADGKIRVWDRATRTLLAALTGVDDEVQVEPGTHNVYCVAFHPNGRLFASGSGDGAIRLWDVAAVVKTRR